MRLYDIIRPETVVPNLKAITKEGSIRELVSVLVKCYRFLEHRYEVIVEAIMNRERLGSTGIGNSVSIPHTKIPNLTQMGFPVIGVLGCSKKGLDFNSIDGSKVNLIFLFIGDSANDKTNEYLKILGLIARAVQQPNFCRFLRQAKNIDEIIELIKDTDEKIT